MAAEALAVEVVLEFLDRNGFPLAAAALREDIPSQARSDLSRPAAEGGGDEAAAEQELEEDLSRFPLLLLPPVRTSVDRRGDGETDSQFTFPLIPSSSSSSTEEPFLSMGSSPTDLTNPQGLWATTRRHTESEGDDDDNNSSNRHSDFGTARDYMEPGHFGDTFSWFDDTMVGSRWKQPFLTRSHPSGAAGGSSRDGSQEGKDAEQRLGKQGSSDFLSDVNPSSSWIGNPGPSTGKGCQVFPGSSAHCDLCSSGAAVRELHSAESVRDKDEDPDVVTYTLAQADKAGVDKDQESALYSNRIDGADFWQASNLDLLFGPASVQRDISSQSLLPEKELHILSINGNADGGDEIKFLGEYDSSCGLQDAKDDRIQNNIACDVKMVRSHGNRGSRSVFEEPSKTINVNGLIDHKEYGIIHENQNVENSEKDKSNGSQVLDFQDEEYEIFELRIVHRKNRTGFEENKDFPVIMNSLIAGRYLVTEYLGSAAFSKVIQAHDLLTGMDVCLKIIKNDKDFFDQSLDEIKLLKFVNKNDPVDEHHMLRLYDYFYHQEHLFIVCELLKANLYEFQKYNLESGGEVYFTLPRIQSIALQCLEALEYLHCLGIIHCDLKPENILVKSYSRCEIKIIDLGSSCFQTDHLSFYVQSRSYRAPEVILGLPYGQKIDIWSLGCLLAELYSGNVLFANESLEILLGRMIGILGPFDPEMLEMGQETRKYFTKDYDLFHQNETGELEYIMPQRSSLASHLGDPDPGFLSFLQHLLQINPDKRPSATEALHHPWLSSSQLW